VLNHGVGALNIDATRVERLNEDSRYPSNVLGEVTDYQKFFYCPKVNRAERHIGFEAPEPEPFNNPDEMKKHPLWDPSIGTNSHRLMTKIREHQKGNAVGKIETGLTDKNGNVQTFTSDPATHKAGNNHPTVKPVELMKYLVKLVTPVGGKVLDPFTGSGSTGMAAVELDYDFTGCELDPDYVNIATQRITAWKNKTDLNNNPLPEQWFTTGE
jgi:hypothetical protein